MRRALKQLDDQLVLLPPGSWASGDPGPSVYWRVFRHVGGDRPPEHVLTWMDADLEPLPLSMGVVDEVQKHRMDGRNRPADVDARNAKLLERNRRDRDHQIGQLHDEYAPIVERGRNGFTVGTRNQVPYWRRKHRGGHR